MTKKIKSEDQYSTGVSQEINLEGSAGWTAKVLKAFPAFKYKNYRLFFAGQLISLIGTWLQIVALGWLVLKLTNSAFWVGTVAALGMLPILIFGAFAGVIVDRFNKKLLLYTTQVFPMIFALILGVLTILNIVNLTEIIILAILAGIASTLDNPARQAFVVDMVEKKDLASAIALNSATFNASRVIGPGMAGFLISIIGIGGTFIVNGLSFIAVIIALFFINVKKHVSSEHSHPLVALREGISYSVTHPAIKELLFLSIVTSIFGWSYTTLLPVIVQDIYHKDASVLGFLYSSVGLGALLAAYIVSAYAKKIKPLDLIVLGNLVFIVSIFLFTFTKSYTMAVPILFMAGLGLITQFSMINTTIQHIVADKMRGRVMSIYILTVLGMFPIGNFQIGILAQHFGSYFAIRFGIIIVFIFSLIMIFRRNNIGKKIEQSFI